MGGLDGEGEEREGSHKILGHHVSLVKKRDLPWDPTFQGDRDSVTEPRACEETQL